MFRLLITVLSLIASPAFANGVQIMDCDWQSSARNIVEPWEDNSRSFSNGKTRVAALDTIEPAAGWAYVLVLSPPYSELGDRQCRVIGINGSGFAGMDFNQLRSAYDPAAGLSFTVPVDVYDFNRGVGVPRQLWFQLNQATGQIRTDLR